MLLIDAEIYDASPMQRSRWSESLSTIIPKVVFWTLPVSAEYAASSMRILVTRLLTSVRYGVTASDAATLIGVAMILTIVGLLACYTLARRAARLDPMWRCVRSKKRGPED
jgi:hypothetical protein